MLTWAWIYLILHVESIKNMGGLLFLAMVFDMVMVVAITACWWGKYLGKDK